MAASTTNPASGTNTGIEPPPTTSQPNQPSAIDTGSRNMLGSEEFDFSFDEVDAAAGGDGQTSQEGNEQVPGQQVIDDPSLPDVSPVDDSQLVDGQTKPAKQATSKQATPPAGTEQDAETPDEEVDLVLELFGEDQTKSTTNGKPLAQAPPAPVKQQVAQPAPTPANQTQTQAQTQPPAVPYLSARDAEFFHGGKLKALQKALKGDFTDLEQHEADMHTYRTLNNPVIEEYMDVLVERRINKLLESDPRFRTLTNTAAKFTESQAKESALQSTRSVIPDFDAVMSKPIKVKAQGKVQSMSVAKAVAMYSPDIDKMVVLSDTGSVDHQATFTARLKAKYRIAKQFLGKSETSVRAGVNMAQTRQAAQPTGNNMSRRSAAANGNQTQSDDYGDELAGFMKSGAGILGR